MTTIKSATGDPELTIMQAFTRGLTWLEVDHNGHTLGINVPTAKLAAALGLVTREAWAKTNDALRAELDEAEATIARVRHLRDVSGDTVGVEELDAALDPKPAFVLPTEAGARIKAQNAYGGSGEFEFHLFESGRWINNVGNIYNPAGLMNEFTNHRLIGGAQ